MNLSRTALTTIGAVLGFITGLVVFVAVGLPVFAFGAIVLAGNTQLLSIIGILLVVWLLITTVSGGFIGYKLGKRQQSGNGTSRLIKGTLILFAIALIVILLGVLKSINTYQSIEDLGSDREAVNAKTLCAIHANNYKPTDFTVTPQADGANYAIHVTLQDGKPGNYQTVLSIQDHEQASLGGPAPHIPLTQKQNIALTTSTTSVDFVITKSQLTQELTKWHKESAPSYRLVFEIMSMTPLTEDQIVEKNRDPYPTDCLNKESTDYAIPMYNSGAEFKEYMSEYITTPFYL